MPKLEGPLLCLGRGQEASVKTEKMHGFPLRPHSAAQLALAGPDKDGAVLATAEAYGPKGSGRERLNMPNRHPAKGRGPSRSQSSWIEMAHHRADCLKSTLRNPGGAWLKSRPSNGGSVQWLVHSPPVVLNLFRSYMAVAPWGQINP